MSESRRATRTGDTVGHVEVTFINAITSRPSRITRTRPDVAAARRLVTHFQPYNNTGISAAVIVRVEDGFTYLAPVSLGGSFRSCPCDGGESTCTRTTA